MAWPIWPALDAIKIIARAAFNPNHAAVTQMCVDAREWGSDDGDSSGAVAVRWLALMRSFDPKTGQAVDVDVAVEFDCNRGSGLQARWTEGMY